MDFISTQKFELTSPRKLREVVYLIKKMTPVEAVEKLPYLPKRAGVPLRKVIMTAIANAKQEEVSGNDLVFKEIQIGEGPRLKRYRAGARGRAKPYKRRMSHIRVVLTAPRSETKDTKSEDIKDKADKRTKAKKDTKSKEVKKGNVRSAKPGSSKNSKKRSKTTIKRNRVKRSKKGNK